MVSHKTKQNSVLAMNTIAFAFNFAVWTMFSIIGLKIKQQLGLSDTQFGVLVATPILTGSLTRLPLGILSDHFGGRIVYLIQMIVVAIATYSLAFATEYWQYLVAGLFVGLAGGSFAIGIAYTSAWFEKEKQGLAMGIFGAGNAGAAITNLIAPIIVVAAGWQMVPKVYSIAMAIMAIVFWVFTYNDPLQEERKYSGTHKSISAQLEPLKELRVWRFGLYYHFVFGGFVALALWLPKYYMGAFGLDIKTASFITIMFTLPSGLFRALGGFVSDKLGARTVNWWVFWISASCLFLLSYPETHFIVKGINGNIEFNLGLNVWVFTILIMILGITQGFGSASVYKLIHNYYPNNMGSVGGMVGVLGGLGGFTIPIIFGLLSDYTNVRSSCFMLLFVLVALCLIWMNYSIIHDRKNSELL